VRTLLIDNHDSFTFNLFQLIASINGEEPLVVGNDQHPWEELARLDFDNIVISPGPGRPENIADFGVCGRAIVEADAPLLGVCLGHQGIAHFFGGTVRHAPEPVHGRPATVTHDGSPLFAGIPRHFSVIRYHSLIVDPALPPCLGPTAWTADGLLMGLAHRSLPRWGVQFHPESICSEHGARLLTNFRDLTASADRARPRATGPRAMGPELLDSATGHRARRPELPYHEAPRPPTGAGGEAPLVVRSQRLGFYREAGAIFQKLYQDEPLAFWLDSSRAEAGLARFSFLGGAGGPLGLLVTYDARAGEVTVTEGGQTRRQREDIFQFLDRELKYRRCEAGGLPFDLDGGFVGYLGYEVKAAAGGDDRHRGEGPDAAFVFADRLIAVDHRERQVYLVCLGAAGGGAAAEAWFAEVTRALSEPDDAPAPAATGAPLTLRLDKSRGQYLDLIARCQNYLRDGESYEICLTNRIHVDPPPDPPSLYLALRQHNPAPYASYLRFPSVAVLCSSPERFLKIDRGGQVESKPIKGTRPRGDTPEQDAALRLDLAGNEKDRSENLMIVDLLRNDLGRVCEVGSVHVPALMQVESYQTVHQLVSTVRGKLRPGVTAVSCARAAFPGGSMTGAPKLRTMKIIDELEQGPRGVYSGAIGYFSASGAADLNIVIRALVSTPAGTTIGVGGAVVALSDPEEEFEETLVKARALVDALVACSRGGASPALREQLLQGLRSQGRSSLDPEG